MTKKKDGKKKRVKTSKKVPPPEGDLSEPTDSLPEGDLREPMGSLPCSAALRMEVIVVPRRSVDEWGTLIKEDLGRAVEGIVSAGLHLEQAFAQLGKGEYGKMLRAINLHSETAKRLRRIANNSALRNPEHYARLPASMRTLSELASIAAPTLEVYIASGAVHVGLEREDAEVLRHAPPPPDKPSLEQMEARQAENAEAEARELEQRALDGPRPYVEYVVYLRSLSEEEVCAALARLVEDVRHFLPFCKLSLDVEEASASASTKEANPK